jgi:hypothetical protein
MSPRRPFRLRVVLVGLLSWVTGHAEVQKPGFNYDEAKVPPYTLPDVLTAVDGSKVTDVKTWETRRRPELLGLFADHMHGRTPAGEVAVREERMRREPALAGRAIRKQVRLVFERNGVKRHVDVLMYLPAEARGPVPAFLGLNFHGNHTVHADPGINLPTGWVANIPAEGLTNNVASERLRGYQESRWQVEKLIGRGYAVVTAYYGDFFPDHAEGRADSVIALYQSDVTPTDWNAVGAWAWGLSRLADYLAKSGDIDMKRLALHGHSRLGKAALWAGAQDERFALVIANDSGEGGAALARRWFGETTKRINASFPHWFSGAFKRYDDREATLPFDQHALLALIAPRPLYIASATDDLWADPTGEFLSAYHAGPVYALYGKAGVGRATPPAPDQPVGDVVAYHRRTGEHDIKAYDWDRYLDFAERHLGRPGSGR